MPKVEERALAKINLNLAVLGRRSDGYHELDMLVVFADVGDDVTACRADEIHLDISGPFGDGLAADPTNLAWKAAQLVCPPGAGAHIHLTKNLPVAAGIGGGSADAAAVLRAISRLYGVDISGDQMARLGADVAMCFAQSPVMARGTGELLQSVDDLPPFWLLLANSGAPVSTAAVFGKLASYSAAFELPPNLASASELARALRQSSNDLYPPALSVDPGIAQVIAAIDAQDGCLLARMSGSGGTCFGLFADYHAAQEAAFALTHAQPAWWVRSAAASHNP